MRRLEYSRRIRCAPGRARNTAEAVMYLAHVTRERHRLEQERKSLATRIRKIEKRLTMITDTETKLAPSIVLGGHASRHTRRAGRFGAAAANGGVDRQRHAGHASVLTRMN